MSTKEEREAKRSKVAELRAAHEAKLAPERERRIEAAEEALVDALIAANGDARKVIVHRLDDEFGGSVLFWVPTEEYWAAYQRRNMNHEKNGGLPRVIAGMVENPKLLIHPPLPELQRWRDEFPGLYTSVATTITQRCEGGEAGKA
jgi:hypothetical protein